MVNNGWCIKVLVDGRCSCPPRWSLCFSALLGCRRVFASAELENLPTSWWVLAMRSKSAGNPYNWCLQPRFPRSIFPSTNPVSWALPKAQHCWPQCFRHSEFIRLNQPKMQGCFWEVSQSTSRPSLHISCSDIISVTIWNIDVQMYILSIHMYVYIYNYYQNTIYAVYSMYTHTYTYSNTVNMMDIDGHVL